MWARLLDDGVYLCSISTMYRLLAIAGETYRIAWTAWEPAVVRHAAGIGAEHFKSRPLDEGRRKLAPSGLGSD